MGYSQHFILYIHTRVQLRKHSGCILKYDQEHLKLQSNRRCWVYDKSILIEPSVHSFISWGYKPTYPLVIQHSHFSMRHIYTFVSLLKMVLFHTYVSLPEGMFHS